MPTPNFSKAVQLLCSLLAFGITGATLAQDKPVMTWTILDLPPGMTLVDEKPVDGISAIRLKMIMANMPEYRHEFQVMTAARIVNTLSQPDAKGCLNNALMTPEREKKFYMSSTGVSLPHSVVAKPETLKKLAKNAAGEVLPVALFERTDLVGVVNPGRSYSALFDTLIQHNSSRSKIMMVPPTRGGANVMQMVASAHADYTIDYEATLAHLMSTDAALKDAPLQALPLAGGVLTPTGFMCPRNAWGYEMIKKIDAILTKMLPDPAFQLQKNRWTSAQSSAMLKPKLEAFYSQRIRNPPTFTPP